ncbi:HAD-IIB family hydrolase, partial [Listeria monocytogenes]|nr:HAD-IIB family hydrolase [Listeria monocytogenes]EIL3087433.1 HAD-IIB family hydrolase [Listeria monocytogenes]
MTQMILTDLDGTLLNTAGEISSLNLKGINALKNAKIDFAIISGRSCEFLERLTNYYGVNCHLIGLNGAEIKLKNSEIVTMDIISQSTAKDIITFLEQKEVVFQTFTVDEELVITGDFVIDKVLSVAKQKFNNNRDILQSSLYLYLELFEGKKQLESIREYIITNTKEVLKLEIIDS